MTVRGGGRGGGGGGRLGRVASGQLGHHRHVLIEVCVLIVQVLFSLAPPCAGSGVLHPRLLGGQVGWASERRRVGGEEDTGGRKRSRQEQHWVSRISSAIGDVK